MKNQCRARIKAQISPCLPFSNAITLSDKIQIIIRFYGEPKVHENYDFVLLHMLLDFMEQRVMSSIKSIRGHYKQELYYMGSKVPLCSIIRTRNLLIEVIP